MNITDNNREFFSEIPVEVASLIIDNCDHHQLPHLTLVCKLWNDIIVENKQYRDFKISKSFTVASTWTDHSEKTEKKWYDDFRGLMKKIVWSSIYPQHHLEFFSKMNQSKLLNLSGIYVNDTYMYEGYTPLIFACCEGFYRTRLPFIAKKLLGMGAKVNVATCIETLAYAYLEKHTTPLFAAAVVAKNLDAVLCFKSHGGIAHPKFDPIKHEEAIVLLKEADDILYGKPVRLVEGFKSKNSILSKLPRHLISQIGAIYMSLYR